MHKMLRTNMIGTGLTLMLGLAACGAGTSIGTTGQDPMTSMQPPNACLETIEAPKGDPNATYIPMGMLGVNFGSLGFLTEVMVTGTQRPRLGNAIYGQYGQNFSSGDGAWFMVVALTNRHFRDLTERNHLEQHGSGRGVWYGLK